MDLNSEPIVFAFSPVSNTLSSFPIRTTINPVYVLACTRPLADDPRSAYSLIRWWIHDNAGVLYLAKLIIVYDDIACDRFFRRHLFVFVVVENKLYSRNVYEPPTPVKKGHSMTIIDA